MGSSSTLLGSSFDLAQLVEHQEAVLLVADDAGCSDLDVAAGQSGQALGGELEEAFVAREDQELLGVAGARQRPQASAGTAGHDDGLNGDHSSNPLGCWSASASCLAHAGQAVNGAPAELLGGKAGVGPAGGHVAGAAGHDLIGHGAAAAAS